MIMKNIKYILMTVVAALFVTSCDWFVLDNMESYDAKVAGKFVDAETGALVPSEVYSSQTGVFKIFELGWDAEAAQTWYIKNNGTYCNNLVWAGDYRMETNDANYYPFSQEFKLKKGNNEVDFAVKPFVRFLNQEFSYDVATKKIKATCTVQVTDPAQTNTLKEVRLCCYTDCHVGTSFNNCKNDAEAVASNVQFDADGKATVTVYIDTQDSANATEFKYERVHYVRLAALATGSANSASRYNFTQTYSIALDGSAAVEYDRW
jgi:hypothetical protein